MRKKREFQTCEMPACAKASAGKPDALRVLVLNASLKHAPDTSNTEELANEVLDAMKEFGEIISEVIRLADKKIPVGLGFRESDDDEWPSIVEKIKAADVIIFATPVWWGGRSSLMQRLIERFDALDEEYSASGRSAIYNKVAGIVITGSEDGAQATLGSLMSVLTWFGFTFPPEASAYWVGEVGMDPKTDRERRLKNQSAHYMAKTLARNLSYFGKLLKQHPLVPKR
jgi:multimeric flavodoxin WrbA